MNFVLHGYPVSSGITVGSAHLVSTAVFDNEHSLTFAEGGDRLPDQPGDGRLVCRAVADNQCPTTLGQAFDHPLKR